jgi:hypothetical protein
MSAMFVSFRYPHLRSGDALRNAQCNGEGLGVPLSRQNRQGSPNAGCRRRQYESTALGSLGIALAEANAEIDYFRPWIDGRLPKGIFDHDALVVLGGEQNALDTRTIPICQPLPGSCIAFPGQARPSEESVSARKFWRRPMGPRTCWTKHWSSADRRSA